MELDPAKMSLRHAALANRISEYGLTFLRSDGVHVMLIQPRVGDMTCIIYLDPDTEVYLGCDDIDTQHYTFAVCSENIVVSAV